MEHTNQLNLTLAKRRTTYAIATFCDTWVVSVRRFFPLFLAWGVSGALPVAILIVTVIMGGVFDWKAGFGHPAWGTVVGMLIPAVFIGGLWAGWNYIALKVVRGIPVRASDIFRPMNQTLSALVALAISSVLIGIGTALFVVPGALLFLRFQLTAFYIVDRNYGPIQALKQSWDDTERVFVQLGLLDLMMLGVGTLSAPLIFGPLMVHIASTVASAEVYSKWLTDENNPDFPKLEDLD
ncbi:MAG: hypothetical protein SGJ27_10235 [Candidatus Melainabacteria bacterium]|nr:hypothetical protein [Candidatus Melainabacteria bacterium]